MTDLAEAVSVVTGGASGIGRATSIALARAGSAVVVADIDSEGAKAVAEEIGDALALQIDVSDREQVEELVARSIAWKGHCDVFVSNAGVGCIGAPQEFTHDEWENLLGVNLLSAIWPIRRVLPHMIERGSGHLVYVSSGAGIESQPDRAPYNVAKFGVVGLAESLACYVRGTDVHVTLVIPGAVATNAWKRTIFAGGDDGSKRSDFRDQHANWPTPESMADAILDGIRDNRYLVAQYNPWEPDWYRNIHERKGRDPEGFVRS